jgi:pimeloyl-ACP methyl ester carboxylesterase
LRSFAKGRRLAATERMPVGVTRDPALVFVFLHGLACTRGQFCRQFEGLDVRLRLLSLDLPGHGGSPDLPSGAGYGIAAVADAAAHELAVRNYTDSLLVGHSAGGLVALHIAVHHPHLAAGLVVIDSNAALSQAARDANRRTREAAEVGSWRAGFTEAMAYSWGPDDGAAAGVRGRVFDAIRVTPERVVRPLWRDVLRIDPTDLWRRCPVPARYVRGRRKTDLALLRSLNPSIETVDLKPDCGGHGPHLQRPDLVNHLLEELLPNCVDKLDSEGAVLKCVDCVKYRGRGRVGAHGTGAAGGAAPVAVFAVCPALSRLRPG